MYNQEPSTSKNFMALSDGGTSDNKPLHLPATPKSQRKKKASTKTQSQPPPPPPPSTDDDEFDSFGLLTQFIGPKKGNTPTTTTTEPDQTASELENFKTFYLDRTRVLDRAQSHTEALEATLSRGKIPTKLQINIKPFVINTLSHWTGIKQLERAS